MRGKTRRGARICALSLGARLGAPGGRGRNNCPRIVSHSRATLTPPRRSRREEFHKMIEDAVGRFNLQGVAGRERLGVDEVARVSAPYGGIFLVRWRAPRSPQDQEWRRDLATLLGRIGLEIDCSVCAIVAARAENRLFCEAA